MSSHNVFPVSISEKKPMQGLAFDGARLYSTVPYDLTILEMDKNGAILGRHKARRPFCGICYDKAQKCFWAVCKESPIYIYKLDQNLEEFGRIRINSRFHDPQTAIACDEQRGGLLGISGTSIVSLSESGDITSRNALLAGTNAITTNGELVITANKGAIYVCNDFLSLKQVKYISDKVLATGLAVTDRSADSIEIMLLSREECYNRLQKFTLECNFNLPNKIDANDDISRQKEEGSAEQYTYEKTAAFSQPVINYNVSQPPVPAVQQNPNFTSMMEQVIIDLLNIFPEQ